MFEVVALFAKILRKLRQQSQEVLLGRHVSGLHVDEIIHNGEQLEFRKVQGIAYLRL